MRGGLSGLLLVLWLACPGWSQPVASPSLTPTATPSPTATPRLDMQEDFRPSAQDTDKPAVFGYMILARQADQLGTPVDDLFRKSIVPWGISVALLLLYLAVARRRKFGQ